MRVSKFFSGLFGAAGGVLMALAVVTVLWFGIGSQEQQVPREAVQTASEWMDALSQGELEKAWGMIYGQPPLSFGEAEGDVQALVIQAYRDSLRCTSQTLCQASPDGAQQQAEVTALDLASSWDAIEARAMEIKGASPEQALLRSAQDVLSGKSSTVTSTVTLRLIFRDGRWWVAPDRALERALAGLT